MIPSEKIQNNLSNEFLSLLGNSLDSTVSGIVITNTKGFIVWVNKAFTDTIGYDRDELLYKNMSILNSGKHEKSFFRDLWETLLSGNIWNGEIINKCKDGSFINTIQFITPVKNWDNKIVSFLSFFNISNLNYSTFNLFPSKIAHSDLLLNIINQSPAIGILWKESDIEIVDFITDNIEHFGYTANDFYTEKISFIDIIHPDHRDEFNDKLDKSISADFPKFSIRTKLITNTGKARWVDCNFSTILDQKKLLAHLQCVIVDITDKVNHEEKTKIQEEQLIHADKMVALGTLVTGIAHEINNPNNFILLNISNLKKIWNAILPILDSYKESHPDFQIRGINYTDIQPKLDKITCNIMEGSDRIKRIVDDLTRFAQKNVSDINQLVDINSVVNFAGKILNNLIKNSTNNFTVHYGTDIPEIRSNFQYLEQVVINLITNACQALTNKDEGVVVSTFFNSEKKQISIRVKDEGEGITKENLEHIMDPFFTTKRSKGGTGLGLSISNKLISELGGELSITSSPGKGTISEIILPTNNNQGDNGV